MSEVNLSSFSQTQFSKLLQKEFLTIVPFFLPSYTCVFAPRAGNMLFFHIPYVSLNMFVEVFCAGVYNHAQVFVQQIICFHFV